MLQLKTQQLMLYSFSLICIIRTRPKKKKEELLAFILIAESKEIINDIKYIDRSKLIICHNYDRMFIYTFSPSFEQECACILLVNNNILNHMYIHR